MAQFGQSQIGNFSDGVDGQPDRQPLAALSVYVKKIQERPALTVTVTPGDLCYTGRHEGNIWGWSCPVGEKCRDDLHQRSLLDPGINNKSPQDQMITEVTLLPEWLFGNFWAGEVPPHKKKHPVNLDECYLFSMGTQLEGLSDAELAQFCPGFTQESLVKEDRKKDLP